MKSPPEPPSAPPDEPRDPALSRLAERVKSSSIPEARALVPLSAEARRALTDKLLGPAEDEAPEPAAPSKAVEIKAGIDGSRPENDTAAKGGMVVREPARAGGPPSKRRVWWPLAIAAALAFGAVLAWIGLRGPAPSKVAYHLQIEGDRVVRSDRPSPEGEPVRLRPSTRLLVVLTPALPVKDATLRALVVRSGKARLVHPSFETDGSGRLTIDKPARDALGDQENGPAELVWIVGGPMPDDAEIERIALDPAAAAPSGTAVLRSRAVFEDWGGASLTPREQIEIGGCKAMTRGPRCEVEAGAALVLWAPFGAGEAEIRVDGQALSPKAEAVGSGTRFTVPLPRGAKEATLSSRRLGEPLRLALGEAEVVPSIAAAARAVEKNDLAGAEEALSRAEGQSVYSKLAALRLRARIARRRGDEAGAERLFREAASLASAEGQLSSEIENRLSLAHQALVYRRDLIAAEAEIRAVSALAPECPAWRVDSAYYRGVLAKERGHYSEAIAAFTETLRASERVGLADMEASVLQPLAGLLSIFGRDAEATDLLRRALALAQDTPCERGTALTNLAWAEHRAARTDVARTEAAARAEEALRLLEGASCGHVLATARINAALLQAAAGKRDEARRGLDQLRVSAKDDAGLAPWLVRLEMDIDRATDPARALAAADRLEKALSDDSTREIAFEAALGRAETLDVLNRPEEAARAYREAARREMEWASAAPLGEGRSTFFERQRSAFRAWVDFAVRRAERASGSPDELAREMDVAEVVRWSVGRFAAILAGGTAPSPRAAFSPSSPPPPGEVHIHYHPVRDGFVAVGLTSSQGKMVRFQETAPGASAQSQAAALLDPFADLLQGARRVVVLADRALRDVSFQDLPWRGGVLSDLAPLAYGMGVPASAGEDRGPGADCASKPSVLLVLDPSRNLAGARRAGERIAAKLGASARVLEGEGARRGSLIAALADPCARVFQYDGHAVFGGKDGVDAALLLADGPLTAREILDAGVVGRVPGTVVLSGCETGREEGLGVAQAFLRRGARQVLATTAKVEDALAAELVEALHEQPRSSTEGWDLPAALRTAVLGLRGRGAGASPWSAFRVLVP